MQGANFVADSLLEQRGFEPPVPGAEAITKRNRHIRAGRIQERDGKLYATPTTTDQDHATA